jgi:hypothetical protein
VFFLNFSLVCLFELARELLLQLIFVVMISAS